MTRTQSNPDPRYLLALLIAAAILLVVALTGCEAFADEVPPCIATDTLCIKTLPCRSCTDNCGNPVPVDSVAWCNYPNP